MASLWFFFYFYIVHILIIEYNWMNFLIMKIILFLIFIL